MNILPLTLSLSARVFDVSVSVQKPQILKMDINVTSSVLFIMLF